MPRWLVGLTLRAYVKVGLHWQLRPKIMKVAGPVGQRPRYSHDFYSTSNSGHTATESSVGPGASGIFVIPGFCFDAYSRNAATRRQR